LIPSITIKYLECVCVGCIYKFVHEFGNRRFAVYRVACSARSILIENMKGTRHSGPRVCLMNACRDNSWKHGESGVCTSHFFQCHMCCVL
jgi:hypothetical protein